MTEAAQLNPSEIGLLERLLSVIRPPATYVLNVYYCHESVIQTCIRLSVLGAAHPAWYEWSDKAQNIEQNIFNFRVYALTTVEYFAESETQCSLNDGAERSLQVAIG